MSVGRDGRTHMSATDSDGNTVEMTGDGTSGRTQISDGGNIVQTDGPQVIIERD